MRDGVKHCRLRRDDVKNGRLDRLALRLEHGDLGRGGRPAKLVMLVGRSVGMHVPRVHVAREGHGREEHWAERGRSARSDGTVAKKALLPK